MGTIIVNGKRFEGNSATIRDGKLVIDGKAQDGALRGRVKLQATEGVSGRAQCVASVTTGAVAGEVAAAVSAGDRTDGAIRAVAIASAGNGPRKKNTR
jgi:hypothetical protein